MRTLNFGSRRSVSAEVLLAFPRNLVRWLRRPGVGLILAVQLAMIGARPAAHEWAFARGRAIRGGAGNTAAIFSRVGDVQWIIAVKTANTTVDLTAGTIYLIFTADATNGGRVEKIIIMPLGTNTASVLRLWINTGGVTGTAANNTQIRDISLPATTVSQVAAIGALEVPLNIAMPPAYTLYATVGTTIAAGVDVTAVAGKY